MIHTPKSVQCKGTKVAHVADYILSKSARIDEKDDEGRTPLHLVCIEGDEEGFALLTAKGADVNACTREGEIALHLACWFDHIELVRFLLEAGADVHAEDDQGRIVYKDPEIYPDIKRLLDQHF